MIVIIVVIIGKKLAGVVDTGEYAFSATRFLNAAFLHGSVSPKPLIIPLRPFQIFPKIRGDIWSSRCTTGVVDTGGKWKKIFNKKNLHYFFWTPLGSRVSI
jgi:hypothetical protein